MDSRPTRRAAGRLLVALALAALGGSPGAARGAEPPVARKLSVAASADLRTVLPELIGAFERRSPGSRVEATYGSSGGLAARVRAGEPFDVYLGADKEHAARLREAGLARGEPFAYATGKLVLWVSMMARVDPHIVGMKSVTHPGVRKLAIADPAVDPYGIAAEQALRSVNLLDAAKGKLVVAGDVLEAVQLTQGLVDGALVPWPLAVVPPLAAQGRFFAVPPGTYTPIVQHGVVLAGARDAGLAAAFAEFLLSPAGRIILERHKYSIPAG